MPRTQSIRANKRAIIAIHGWTGNAESLNSLSKQWRFLETNWIFIEGPTQQNHKVLVGLMEMIKMGGNVRNLSIF